MMIVTAMLSLIPLVAANKPAPILFIIQSQKGPFHTGIAERTRNSIMKQWGQLVPDHVMKPPKVLLTSKLLDTSLHDRAWTYSPLFEMMADELEANQDLDWVGILNENTELNLQVLGEYASQSQGKLKPREEAYFLGKSLKDETSTIIHHYHSNTKEKTVLYPDPEPGIFLSRKLVQDLRGKGLGGETDFHIDPEFEFAKFLVEELGVSLTHVEELCSKEPKKSGKKCITFPRQEYKCLKNKDMEGLKNVLDSVYVIVHTCEKMHKTRIPVVKQTWADLFPNIHFISEKVDEDIPTEVLPFTINTERGHCNKTRTFLDRFMEEDYPWLLITDDDTIMSPVRFAQVLACYPAEEPTVLGQRYGYSVANGNGYNYITGGGGKIINKAAVEKLFSLDNKCSCPSASTPEDMLIFGMCCKRAGMPINHSGRMFQARPIDYPSAMVSYRKPISFHKHWEIDPLQVYDDWFRKADEPLREFLNAQIKSGKDEL